MGAHTTSDDPSKYRLADELEHWRLKDPIERVRAYLRRSGSGDEAFFAEVEAEASDYAADLRARCPRSPTPSCWISLIWSTPSKPPLAEQKANYAEYLATFEGSEAYEELDKLSRHTGRRLMTMLTMAKALNAGLRRALEADPKVVIAGEDVGKLVGSSELPRACRRTSASIG